MSEKYCLTIALKSLGLVSGSTGGTGVHQTPELLVERGQSAQMHCSHDLGGSYFQMCWYQQLAGESMKLVVHTVPYNSEPDFGDFSQDKFSATKDEAESGSFTVKNVEPEDSGVYFCAVSTLTVMQIAVKLYKNHSHSGNLSDLIKHTEVEKQHKTQLEKDKSN